MRCCNHDYWMYEKHPQPVQLAVRCVTFCRVPTLSDNNFSILFPYFLHTQWPKFHTMIPWKDRGTTDYYTLYPLLNSRTLVKVNVIARHLSEKFFRTQKSSSNIAMRQREKVSLSHRTFYTHNPSNSGVPVLGFGTRVLGVWCTRLVILEKR
jgi:hypothetical protein